MFLQVRWFSSQLACTDILSPCLTGRFEAALLLAHSLQHGARLTEWLQRITSALAAACVALQQAEHAGAASAAAARASSGGGQPAAQQSLFGGRFRILTNAWHGDISPHPSGRADLLYVDVA